MVDDEGTIRDVLSPRDLRRLRLGTPQFKSLFTDTVAEFKRKVKLERGESPSNVVSLRQGSVLEDVLKAMIENGCIHRVFIVDSSNSPIDIVSQTDILRWMMKRLREGPS